MEESDQDGGSDIHIKKLPSCHKITSKIYKNIIISGARELSVH